jgi:hypothetical protein
MKYIKTFENYKLLEGISAYKFANNLEAMATNRLLTKEERENLENKIYNKIGMASMGIYDKLMSYITKQGRTELIPEDYEMALQELAKILKRELMPPDFIPNDEPDPNIIYNYTDEEPLDISGTEIEEED